MLAVYYQMKMKHSRRESEFEQYYMDNFGNSNKDYLTTKCRICLRQGTAAIYGGDHTSEIVQALEIFGDIQISEDDVYPKHLCTVCSKFIKASILFRKTAKHTDEILKRPVKEVFHFEQSSDHHDYSDSSLHDKDTEQKWEDKLVKQEKKKNTPKSTCHICKKVFSKSYIKEHITMHDPDNPDNKKYVCEVCGKSFRLRCAYYNHSLRHKTDFPFKCQFCPYRGRYKELLKTHMRTHTGEYRYMCSECPARFLFGSNLKVHMLKHKEPTFKCDTCKRGFYTKLKLQRHFEVDHVGIKNHACNLCGKPFGYRNAMMKHQRRVHKREKGYVGRMPSYLQAQCDNQSSNK